MNEKIIRWRVPGYATSESDIQRREFDRESTCYYSADDEETYLRQRIHDITTEYRKAISPYVDRLMWIEARKPPPPVIVEITPENEALVRKLLGQSRERLSSGARRP